MDEDAPVEAQQVRPCLGQHQCVLQHPDWSCVLQQPDWFEMFAPLYADASSDVQAMAPQAPAADWYPTTQDDAAQWYAARFCMFDSRTMPRISLGPQFS